MNNLTHERRSQIIRGLIEGNSISSLVRMTGVAKTTILRLIEQFGEVCEKFHDERVTALHTKRVQMDEIWAFVGAKDRNASDEKKHYLQWGDAWTWTALDADSKLMITWYVGPRNADSAWAIMRDVKTRLTDRIQLTTDGLHSYWSAAGSVFKFNLDYAQLVKVYGTVPGQPEGKYSPPQVIRVEVKPRIGNPDPAHINTSYVERANLTIRMGMRRYTRLTNGHSKKFDNHVLMTSIFLTMYNWCRVHQTLRVTPAMEAGLTDHVWEVDEIIGLLDAGPEEPKKRGPYKKRIA